MTKADLARAIYEKHGGIPLQDCQRAVDLIFTTIKRQLLQGDRVHIVGFGTLEIVPRRARRGRNPATGEEIELPDGSRMSDINHPSKLMLVDESGRILGLYSYADAEAMSRLTTRVRALSP